MKPTCTRIRQSLTTGNLSSCMCICKFRALHDEDYQQIFQIANCWGHTDKTTKRFRPVYVQHNQFLCLIEVLDILLKTFV